MQTFIKHGNIVQVTSFPYFLSREIHRSTFAFHTIPGTKSAQLQRENNCDNQNGAMQNLQEW